MVLLHPEQRIGYQVIGDLRTAIIVNQCPPVGMASLSRVKMLIQASAVKIGQTVSIPGKMGRNPVQNHADPRLVQLIDEIHEIFRGAVPCRRRVIAYHLIPPGTVQGMLHHRHQLHMGIAHLLDVRNQLLRDLPVVGIRHSLRRSRHGAQVHLIHAHRRVPCLEAAAPFQELTVLPGEALQIRHHRSRLRPKLGGIAVGVCLQIGHPALYLELEFIIVPRLCVRQENLKDAGIPKTPHLMDPSVPVVEIAHHAGPQHVRRPNGEIDAAHPFYLHGMSPHLLINTVMDPRCKFLQIRICQLGGICVWIMNFTQGSVVIKY